MIITDTHVFFYGGPAIYSNWYPAKFQDLITGIRFENTEQAFMWQKARFFLDMDIMDEIVGTPNPKEVKLLGRKIRDYDDKAWNCVRYGMMVYVNYLKFSQNNELATQLKAIGNRILVEASPYDKIWGIGLGLEDQEIFTPELWNGQNLLGKALTKVKGML